MTAASSDEAPGLYEAPEYDLEGNTIIFDREAGQQVMRLRGILTMPVGSLIELYQAPHTHGSARVLENRLCAAAGNVGAYVCIDVSVEPGWWEVVLPDEPI